MRRWVYLVLITLALLAAWMSFGHQFDDPLPPVPDNLPPILQPEPELEPVSSTQPAEMQVVQPAQAPRRTVRAIGSDLVTAPPVDTATLQRIEPRRPLGELALAPDPATMEARETLLYRPVALSAGLIEAQGHRVRLEGVETLDADAICGEPGREWPCGALARSAFRAWLRGRAISCTVRPVAIDETVVSKCSLAGHDPAEWLARQGWLREASGAYAAMLDEARAAGRGLYGPPPG
jgi:endonuclease YncB( thermonuclease family)